MKKTLILLLILLISAGAYYYLTQGDGNSSMSIDSRGFVVENKEDIAFITIKNPGYPLVHLQRNSDNNWTLNKKYKANPNVINNMIGVLSSMEIKYIPTKARNKNVIQNLPIVGIEITSFDKSGNVLSELIMGDNDNKESATYCVRKGFDQSYAMHVKVTEGGLRNYFEQTQLNIRDNSVFDINPNDIRSLSMTYAKDRKNSFLIFKEDGKYKIEAKEQFAKSPNKGVSNVIEAYIKDYSQVYAEVIRTGDTSLDTIKNLVPFASLEFKLKNEEVQSYDFYPMLDLLEKEVNTQSVRDLAKIERFFVFASNEEVYVVQRRLIKEFFKPIAYFY